MISYIGLQNGCYNEGREKDFGISRNNECRHWKHFQKKQPFWIPIYEVIEYSYFEETKLFPTIVLNQCRNNPNQTQNIPNEIKADFSKCLCNRGCIHKWLWSAEGSQMIKRNNKNTNKYNFQGQSVRSRRWFDIDHEWIQDTWTRFLLKNVSN